MLYPLFFYWGDLAHDVDVRCGVSGVARNILLLLWTLYQLGCVVETAVHYRLICIILRTKVYLGLKVLGLQRVFDEACLHALNCTLNFIRYYEWGCVVFTHCFVGILLLFDNLTVFLLFLFWDHFLRLLVDLHVVNLYDRPRFLLISFSSLLYDLSICKHVFLLLINFCRVPLSWVELS